MTSLIGGNSIDDAPQFVEAGAGFRPG
jgi:hypothetical protein